MTSFLTFQFGEFTDTSPSWFDWFNLLTTSLISILSIIGGFWIATKIYSKGRIDKEREEKEIQNLEVKLFKNSLIELSTAIENQIGYLKNYLEKQDFSLTSITGIHSDFLKFINIKYLYKDTGIGKKEEIEKINRLMSSLYTLNDFRISLRHEFRSYLNKYHFHEDKFYSYRKLLYSKYFELCNQRGINFIIKQGVKEWQFSDDDKFMIDYSILRNRIFQDANIISQNSLVNRSELVKKFVVPLIDNSKKFIPEDYNAIEVNDIAIEINSAYMNMEHLTNSHFDVIKSYLSILENIKTEIEEYLK